MARGWPSICCGESVLFFVEDVVKVSCTAAARGSCWRGAVVQGEEEDEQRRGGQADAGACARVLDQKIRSEVTADAETSRAGKAGWGGGSRG